MVTYTANVDNINYLSYQLVKKGGNASCCDSHVIQFFTDLRSVQLVVHASVVC
jgi:hypothetical protein